MLKVVYMVLFFPTSKISLVHAFTTQSVISGLSARA